MYNCTLYIVHCTLYIVHCTVPEANPNNIQILRRLTLSDQNFCTTNRNTEILLRSLCSTSISVWNSISRTSVLFFPVEQPNKCQFSGAPAKDDDTNTIMKHKQIEIQWKYKNNYKYNCKGKHKQIHLLKIFTAVISILVLCPSVMFHSLMELMAAVKQKATLTIFVQYTLVNEKKIHH